MMDDLFRMEAKNKIGAGKSGKKGEFKPLINKLIGDFNRSQQEILP